MLRFALARVVLWCASVLGAAVFAAAIAALAVPAASANGAAYLGTILRVVPRVLMLEPGRSLVSNLPAFDALRSGLSASLDVLVPGLAVALLCGAALGALLSLRALRPLSVFLLRAGASVPVFCAALLVGAVAALAATGVPAGNRFSTLAPMAVTVGLAGAGTVALSVARALQVVAREPYTAGLMRIGLTRAQIFRSYVAPHATALALKDLGNLFVTLFAATAVVEWVFEWPGAGAGFIRAVALRDWNVVATLIFIVALVRLTLDLQGTIASRALLGEAPP
jgi:peptide/nickel transport system permease protein